MFPLCNNYAVFIGRWVSKPLSKIYRNLLKTIFNLCDLALHSTQTFLHAAKMISAMWVQYSPLPLANKSCTHTCMHVHTGLFFLLPYPCDLSHIVRKKSTLTQQPIIVFQETQNEMEEKTTKGLLGVQCGSSHPTNHWQTTSYEFNPRQITEK